MLLLLWGADGGLGRADALGVWRDYATDVRGQAIAECKHFLPEERPAAVLEALCAFFGPGIPATAGIQASKDNPAEGGST